MLTLEIGRGVKARRQEHSLVMLCVEKLRRCFELRSHSRKRTRSMLGSGGAPFAA